MQIPEKLKVKEESFFLSAPQRSRGKFEALCVPALTIRRLLRCQ